MPDQNTVHPSSLCKSQRRRVEALLHARAALHGAPGCVTVGQVLGLSQIAAGVHADPAELLWLAEFIETGGIEDDDNDEEENGGE